MLGRESPLPAPRRSRSARPQQQAQTKARPRAPGAEQPGAVVRPPGQEAATRDQEAATPGRGAEAPGPGAEAPVSEAMATAHLVRTVAAGDADRPWARDRGEGSPRVVADMRIQVGSGCVSARSHRWRHSTSRADRPPLPRCECMAVPRLRAGASRFVRMRPGAYLRGNSMSVRPKR